MVNRIDAARADDARRICEFILSHIREDGRYLPPEAMNVESSLYQGSLAATLALAGHLLEEECFIEAAGRMFDRLMQERVEGLWPIGWWAEYPTYRPVSLQWREQNRTPHVRATALMLYCLGVYRRAAGDDRFTALAGEALEKMFDRWDIVGQKDTILHGTADMTGMAISVWQDVYPQYTDKKDAIVKWAADTYADLAENDFPFFAMYRFMFLMIATGTEHLHAAIHPGIDAILDDPTRRFEHNANDFCHTPHTSHHVNIRANGAVAILMRLFDLAVGETIYTGKPLYQYVSRWMDEMRTPEGGCYGCRSFDGTRRYGLGSPPHYVQLWWILGGFFL